MDDHLCFEVSLQDPLVYFPIKYLPLVVARTYQEIIDTQARYILDDSILIISGTHQARQITEVEVAARRIASRISGFDTYHILETKALYEL